MKGYKGGSKVGMLFSGGPAPSANAVISLATLSFLNARIPVYGFFYGFEYLENFDYRNRYSLVEGVHYEPLTQEISGVRNRRGVYLKTSRANPGKNIRTREDLQDTEKTKKLNNILKAFETLGIGYLVTIGGDDTLKTANYLSLLGLPVIHIP